MTAVINIHSTDFFLKTLLLEEEVVRIYFTSHKIQAQAISCYARGSGS